MKLTKKQKTQLVSLFILVGFLLYSLFTPENNNLSQQSETQTTIEKTNEGVLDETQSATGSGEIAQVTRVIDGDTIEINGNKTVRYIGIDTPETVDPRKDVQCFGQEASDKNKELVLNKTVRLEKDVSDTDRYGRLLRYVFIESEMVNEVLVHEGYAQARSYPPDVRYQERLRDAEEKARAENSGLWGRCQ